jgi:hypothetical protein
MPVALFRTGSTAVILFSLHLGIPTPLTLSQNNDLFSKPFTVFTRSKQAVSAIVIQNSAKSVEQFP